MAPGWADPRVPAPERAVLRYALEKHADERPQKVFARLASGAEWTFAEMLAAAKGQIPDGAGVEQVPVVERGV